MASTVASTEASTEASIEVFVEATKLKIIVKAVVIVALLSVATNCFVIESNASDTVAIIAIVSPAVITTLDFKAFVARASISEIVANTASAKALLA